MKDYAAYIYTGYDEPARLKEGDILDYNEGMAFVERVNESCALLRLITDTEYRFIKRWGYSVLCGSRGAIVRISRMSPTTILYRRGGIR